MAPSFDPNESKKELARLSKQAFFNCWSTSEVTKDHSPPQVFNQPKMLFKSGFILKALDISTQKLLNTIVNQPILHWPRLEHTRWANVLGKTLVFEKIAEEQEVELCFTVRTARKRLASTTEPVEVRSSRPSMAAAATTSRPKKLKSSQAVSVTESVISSSNKEDMEVISSSDLEYTSNKAKGKQPRFENAKDGCEILLQPGSKPSLSTMVSTDGQYSPPTEAHAESLDILSIPSVLKDLPHQLLVDKAACNFPLGSRQRDLIASAEYYKGKRAKFDRLYQLTAIGLEVESIRELEQSKAKETYSNSQQLAELQSDIKLLTAAGRAQVKKAAALKARVTGLEAELLELKQTRDKLQAEKLALKKDLRYQQAGRI